MLLNVEIVELERELNTLVPEDVKTQYRQSNGLLGPTGCNLLYRYKSGDNGDIIHVNRVLKSESWFPASLISIVIYGDDGCGNLVCFDNSKNKAFLWNPQDGEVTQEERNTVKELWDLIIEWYESEV